LSIFETLQLETSGHISILTLNRPKALNAINMTLAKELENALNQVSINYDTRVLILRGSASNFSAGADIKDRPGVNQNLRPEDSDNWRREYLSVTNRVYASIWNFPIPVIAEIRGYCLGGGLILALMCDIRVGSDQAKLGLPEVKRGVFPGQGGTQYVAKYIGLGKAKLLTLSGQIIDGRSAYSMGLLDCVTAEAELENKAKDIAIQISENSPVAVRCAKWLINKSLEVPPELGIMLEQLKSAENMASEDYKEGVRAFAEKRKPVFKGK
jgi:enoyl-CoA hydratase/carnithine racemase